MILSDKFQIELISSMNSIMVSINIFHDDFNDCVHDDFNIATKDNFHDDFHDDFHNDSQKKNPETFP